VVTREVEWDDETRERALDLQQYEEHMCLDGCGMPIHEASKEQPFVIDHYTCHATRALETLKLTDKQQAEKDGVPEGWDTGRHYFVKDVAPPRGEAQAEEDQRGD
jgi:hypothetical protein